jgi:hypothetical protein
MFFSCFFFLFNGLGGFNASPVSKACEQVPLGQVVQIVCWSHQGSQHQRADARRDSVLICALLPPVKGLQV